MIEQLAMDVEAPEADKFRIRYCNDFELSGGGDPVQPAVDLIFAGQRVSGRRPVDELSLIEQGKKAGGMFGSSRVKLNALRWREPALRGALNRAVALGRRVGQSVSRSACFHRPDLCCKPDNPHSYWSRGTLIEAGVCGSAAAMVAADRAIFEFA